MDSLVLLHNPACGNSRKALETLRSRGVAFAVVEYLKAPLDAPALRRLLARLDVPPAELVRKDKRFAELGLRAEDYATADAVVALLARHPELMQRPVAIRGERAIVARPGETVERIL